MTDKPVDTAVGEQNVGIPECDEALNILSAQANDPNDNFLVKAAKKTALNAFRDQLKKSLEQSNTNKVDVARYCKDFRDNLDKSLQEQENTNTAK
jgi:transcriptional regulator with AAA-type ATPase domain